MVLNCTIVILSSLKPIKLKQGKLILNIIIIKYPEMVFFIGVKLEVKISTSLVACSNACCSLSPTTDSGGMLFTKNYK